MRGDPRDRSGASGGAARAVPGRTVGGRYRLESVLGRGGMGVVWAAHDELLGRDVAVKEVLAPRGLDDGERELQRARTLREARTAARISAEGVVAILDAVEDDGRPWIVMERLPPRTLEDELTERGGIPPREAALIASSLLAGLSAAHEAGILHRDVKPSNVMFRETPRGPRAVLADFGIAHVDGDAALTATGQMMGSPAYIAPERARGEPASAASDLWSLGVTVWAAVEGWSPFQRVNSLASLTAVITEEPPRAEHAGPLEPFLAGLLRKDPVRRIDARTARRLLAGALEPPPPSGTAATQRPAPHVVPRATVGAPAAPPSLPGPVLRPASVPVSVPVSAPVGAPDQGTRPAAPPRAPAASSSAPAPPPPAPPVPGPPADTPPWWAPAPVAGQVRPSGRDPDPGRRRGRRLLPVVAAVVTLGLVGLGVSRLDAPDGSGADDQASPGTSGTSSGPGTEADQQPAGAVAGEADDAAADGSTDAAAPGSVAPADPGATDGESAGAGEPAPGAAPGAEPDPGAQPGAQPGGGTGADDPGAVPPGFERHSDPTGFSVAVPAGWQVEREGPRVYLHDPASAAYLLVDQTDDPAPDPVADWQQQEPAVARRLAGYTRIGEIAPVEYRGWAAADWEFVFGPGGRTHVLNRNVVTAPDQAYALYWSVPSSMWEAMRPAHEVALESFLPAG